MTEKELQQKYPAYSKSIFSDFMPDDKEVMGWQKNVLEKVKGDNILPHYIEKDRDFDIFWGWITHFFAIIVYFGRNFKKFFTNYTSYLNEIREFMRERNYIQDSRVQINKDLQIPLTEEIYHKIFCGYRIINGVLTKNSDYYCSDYLPVTDGAVINLKVIGYNQSLKEYSGSVINNVDLVCYTSNKTFIGGITFNIEASQAKSGYRITIPSYSNSDSVCYIRISYPRLGDSLLPLYLGVFLEGDGAPFETNRTEEDIFAVHSNFRKRGTFKGASLIKKILETKKEDSFYADYLPQINTGWFLNRNSPIFGELYQKIQIDSLYIQSSNSLGYYFFKTNFFSLNQNTSFVFNFRRGDDGSSPFKVKWSVSLYDINKEKLSGHILTDWIYDSDNHTLTSSHYEKDTIEVESLIYSYGKDTFTAELPIEIIDCSKNLKFSTDTYDKNSFSHSTLFSKYNDEKTKEAYYIRIVAIRIISESNPPVLTNENCKVGLYLRKLPITMGFLNNKQYYLCYFKNNGSYSNSEAVEIIDQKVIPYNGYRLFIDNTYYRNIVTIPLDLKNIYFDKIYKKIHLEIVGGVPPYSYQLIYLDDLNQKFPVENKYLQVFEKAIIDYGQYEVIITDALDKQIFIKISCQSFNSLNYKFKLFISKDNSIQTFIKLFGGTETSYNINNYVYHYLYDNAYNQLLDINRVELLSKDSTINGDITITTPANVWVDITKIIGNNFNKIVDGMTLFIEDNGIPIEAKNWLDYKDLELNLQELFHNFALDFYDNGVGELVG